MFRLIASYVLIVPVVYTFCWHSAKSRRDRAQYLQRQEHRLSSELCSAHFSHLISACVCCCADGTAQAIAATQETISGTQVWKPRWALHLSDLTCCVPTSNVNQIKVSWLCLHNVNSFSTAGIDVLSLLSCRLNFTNTQSGRPSLISLILKKCNGYVEEHFVLTLTRIINLFKQMVTGVTSSKS